MMRDHRGHVRIDSNLGQDRKAPGAPLRSLGAFHKGPLDPQRLRQPASARNELAGFQHTP